jgi:hypothetical protein
MASSASGLGNSARARWRLLLGGLVAGACATYDPPQALNGYTGDDLDSLGGGSAGTQAANTDAGRSMVGETAGSAGKGTSGAGATAGSSTSGSAGSGTAGTSAGIAGGGASAGGSAGSAGTVADGGEAGSADAPPTCAACDQLKSALVHRYDFEGTGTVVMDRVGKAHGSIKGGASLSQLDGKGVVVLAGGTSGAYVDLPNGVLSALTNATLEAWVTWGGGNGWQRIFDFGDSTNATPEDNPASGKSYLFLTPMTDMSSGGALRAVYSIDGGAAAAETRAEGVSLLPQSLKQVVVVVDASGGQLRLFVDGTSVADVAFNGSLSSIHDVNAWLGRSQYAATRS